MMFETEIMPIPDEISAHGHTAQLAFLAIGLAERALSPDEISEAIRRPVDTVRLAVADLAEDGLVDRRRDPRDGRRRVYDLP